MSLLNEITDAAVDSQTSLLVVLRKCRVLAARLGNKEFKDWVICELDGYPKEVELPEYRILRCQSKGHLSGPFGSGMQHAPLPLNNVPEKYRDLIRMVQFRDSIAAIEDLVKSSNGDSLQSAWPNEVIPYVQSLFYQNMILVQAWREIPRARIVGIVETIRNRVLNFTLEIESEAPNAGEPTKGANPIPEERVQHVFHTVITGNVQNLSTGGSHFTQNAHLHIETGNFEELSKYLSDIGVSQKDIGQLKTAIKTDGPLPSSPTSFGSKVAGWIGKMVSKSVQGVWSVSAPVAAELLRKSLNKYFGLE